MPVFSIMLALLAVQGEIGGAPPEPSASTTSAAMAEALANKAQMARGPQLIGSFDPAYSREQRAAGMQGDGRILLVVGADGTVSEATLQRSSAPPELDAAALKAARALTFKPATDKAGNAIAVPAILPFSFQAADENPLYVSRVDPEFSDAARAAGEHGKVVIAGKIGADGQLFDAVVATSSRSPTLDAAALAAAQASRLRPYRDNAGQPLAVPVNLSFAFDNYHTPGPGGGILRYRCDQFVRDENWWQATWPASEKNGFYTLMLGLSMMSQGVLSNPSGIKEAKAAFDARLADARRDCAAQPDRLFVDVMKVEGPAARRLAEKAK